MGVSGPSCPWRSWSTPPWCRPLSCSPPPSLPALPVQLSLLRTAHLYIGLAIFCGFIMFDTQVIIRKARNGDKDFIAHSLDLFIDFVQIFRKVLILLMQKDERDNKNKRR